MVKNFRLAKTRLWRAAFLRGSLKEAKKLSFAVIDLKIIQTQIAQVRDLSFARSLASAIKN